MSNCINNAQMCCIGTAWVVGGLAFVALSPVIGVIGSIACLITAKVHDVAANQFLEKTKDDKGVAIKDRQYMSKDTKYTLIDKAYLENEQNRLTSLDERDSFLKFARGLAKCILSIPGVVWALFTEMGSNGSMPLGCQGCLSHEDHWGPKEALYHHLTQIKDAEGTKRALEASIKNDAK